MTLDLTLVSLQHVQVGRTYSVAMVGEILTPAFANALQTVINEHGFSEHGFARLQLSVLQALSLEAHFTHAAADFWPIAKSKQGQFELALFAKSAPPSHERQFQEARTKLVFELFNCGALRGNDTPARQLLMDSFGILPNRFLSAEGDFLAQENQSIGGIDKFPSLLSTRANELIEDGNRIVPGAFIRNGVHVGKGNIFMFHAAVNLAAFIGDGNLVDSHASVGSAAQIGNKNKIGSFVSLEGVLSPANAQCVVIGDENFLGSFARIGTGIVLGNKNFIGSGVNLSLGTKIKDCREESPGKGSYLTPRDLLSNFNALAIMPNNALRELNGISLVPGEYALIRNTEDFMLRFEGDPRIKTN